MTTPRPLGWWSISGETIMEMLHRAHDGEDPDMLYLELTANSETMDYGKEES
jgi:hypothetical protein